MLNTANTILDPISEIVCFIGPRGVGKSTLMRHFVDEYMKTQVIQRWELSDQIIRGENARRKTPLSFPNAPPIYTNTKYDNLKTRSGIKIEPIPITGKEIGINIEGIDEGYKDLFPAPLIVLDEAENEFVSKGEHLPKGQLKFLSQCRHYRVLMLLAAPRAVFIHKDIRASGVRVIEPRKFVNEFDVFNRLYKTTWYCREFHDSSALEEYISTDGKSDGYINTTYTHNGNIRELVNSFEYERDFFPKEGKDFET